MPKRKLENASSSSASAIAAAGQIVSPVLGGDSQSERMHPSAAQLARLLRIDRFNQTRRPPGWTEADLQRSWWLLSGRVELARGTRISHEDMTWLLQPVPGWPNIAGLTMTHALWFAWHNRPELQTQFPLQALRQGSVNSPPSNALIRLLCWFLSDAMRELQLAADLPKVLVEQLNRPAPAAFWPEQTRAEDAPPLLMAATLQTRPELHAAFDLKTIEGQQTAWLWFFTAGAARLGLTPLISRHWLDWCMALTPTGPYGLDLPRLAFLKWSCDSSFRKRYPLTRFEHQKSILQWLEETLESDPDWSWHKLDAVQRTSAWLSFYGTQSHYPPPSEAFGINLIGFAKGELGIGEDIRTAAQSCEGLGIPFSIINISPGGSVRQADETLAHKMNEGIAPTAPYPVNVFCLTGFDTARVFVQQGPSLFKGRHNIGWWPWELPVWPAAWSGVFDLVDEVWAATSFNHAMYSKATSKPVHIVPLNFHLKPPRTQSRKAFNLPAKAFLFLYIFDGNSYPQRKNPLAAIRAFQAAFSAGDRRVGLVFKTMNGKPDNPDWQAFTTACAQDARITIIHETLDKADVQALMQTCDAYVSLHRAEGYGRTLVEALLLGKPVIATDWSGNTDFLTEETGFPVSGKLIAVQPGDYPFVSTDDGAQWCDVDVGHAASRMREVFELMQTEPQLIAARCENAKRIFDAAPAVLKSRLQSIRLPRLLNHRTER